MPRFIFFDYKDTFVSETESILSEHIPNAQFVTTDVRELDADIYISPANSYGWMNGGIDGVYSEMFPNVSSIVQQKIGEVSVEKGIRDKPTLSIGSAVIVPVKTTDGKSKKLICAPTMERPRNITNSPENIYYAMMAIFSLCDNIEYKDKVVAVPGLGTGCGGLSHTQSAQEIIKAYNDYEKNIKTRYPIKLRMFMQNNEMVYLAPKFLI
jgi:O-acetyl-ADP-ribose deacetylase (regulator of RNase III)